MEEKIIEMYGGDEESSALIQPAVNLYVANQNMWLEANGVVNGTKVRVVTKVPSFVAGWLNSWEPNMDNYVGQVLRVSLLSPGSSGIPLYSDGHISEYSFPYYVLEVVK